MAYRSEPYVLDSGEGFQRSQAYVYSFEKKISVNLLELRLEYPEYPDKIIFELLDSRVRKELAQSDISWMLRLWEKKYGHAPILPLDPSINLEEHYALALRFAARRRAARAAASATQGSSSAVGTNAAESHAPVEEGLSSEVWTNATPPKIEVKAEDSSPVQEKPVKWVAELLQATLQKQLEEEFKSPY